MIKFEGTLCKDTKEYLVKKSRVSYIFSCVIGTVIPFVFASVIIKKENWFLDPLLQYGVLILISLFLVFGFLFINVKNERFFPQFISIEKEQITYKSNLEFLKRKTEKVKTVWDYGKFYELELPFLMNGTTNIICQKDLLVEGTIEEFEALFEGKIEHCENGY